MNIDSTKTRVDMWIDAIMKMRQGIQMQYQDTVWAKDTWEDCNYDPENPPDFDKDLIWREKPLDSDDCFESWIEACRLIRAGKQVEYKDPSNDKWWIFCYNNEFPPFKSNVLWREYHSEHDENEKQQNIRQITIIPNYSYDCSGNVTISLNIKMDDDALETVHYVTPCNPFYIVI